MYSLDLTTLEKRYNILTRNSTPVKKKIKKRCAVYDLLSSEDKIWSLSRVSRCQSFDL